MRFIAAKYKFVLLIVIFTAAISLFTSCNRHLTYINEIETDSLKTFYPKNEIEYRIRPRDILKITVYSQNEEASAAFNLYSQNQRQYGNSESNREFSGYTVKPDGKITVPVVGDIPVSGLTIEQVQHNVEKEVKQYIQDAIVIVKLMSFRITLLGEVNGQGIIQINRQRINILEAIAMAGGISDYGNRKKVLVVRPDNEGYHTFYVDLTKRELLSSEDYFLYPNDMVYVEPIKAKAFRVNASDFTLVLSTITTTLTSVFLILNYLK